jgi:hypothetical protein
VDVEAHHPRRVLCGAGPPRSSRRSGHQVVRSSPGAARSSPTRGGRQTASGPTSSTWTRSSRPRLGRRSPTAALRSASTEVDSVRGSR